MGQEEDAGLRAAALKNAVAIEAARQRAERDLVIAKDALETKGEELQRQRAWFEVTLSSIGDAVIAVDIDGKVTFMNSVAEQLTGWTRTEAVGESVEQVFKIVNEITGLPAANPVREVLGSGGTMMLADHMALVSRTGSVVAIEDSAAPIRDPGGQVSGSVMVFHDVTIRRRTERALRASEERFRAAFAQAAVGMAVASVEGRFLELNERFCEILGRTREELLALTFADITHRDDLDGTLANVERLRSGEIPFFALEKRYLRKDGTIVWSRTVVSLLRESTSQQFIAVIEDISDRKAAEEAVRESAQRLQLALAAGDLSDWSWDKGTGLVSLGRRAAEILCVPQDQPVRWSDIRERLLPEDRERTYEAIVRLLQERTVRSLEFGVIDPQGQRAWVAARGQGVYDNTGELLGAIGVVQEITDRKQADEARGRLAAVVETSADAIISTTLEGIIVTWNEAAERMYGYAPHEVIGKPVTVLIPEGHEDEESSILERLKRGERIDHYETVRVRKGGARINVSLSVSPIRDHEGAIIGASKIARDITRQKQAEQILGEERGVLELLNATGAAIASQLDVQAVVQLVTDSATKLSGARFGAFFYNVTNPEGESFVLFALSGAPRAAFEKFGLPRNTPIFNPTFRGEAIIRSPDITKDPRYGRVAPHHGMPKGHPAVRSYLAVPVKLRSGETIGSLFFGHPEPDIFTERSERLVVGVAAQAAIAMDNARLYEAAQREIDSRERAEAALRETDRRKDEFLATLAHELRNPLAPIRQAALISKAEGATKAEKRWSHDVIARQVNHMALLLDDLLDISRITRGTLELRTEMTEFADVVEAAIETARPAIDAKRHRLMVDLPAEPVRLAADPLRLAQILSNLLANAAKYTDPAGEIRLSAVRDGGTLVIRVADTGIGIPPPMLARVFGMFSQLQSSLDRSEGGLGIGLALARGLVDLHEGTIEAASEGPGRGSEFTVRLPLRTLDQKAQAETPGAAQLKTAPRRVLIADDNQDAADSLAVLLRLEGHEVTVVHNGADALEAFATTQPEVALLDIGMPGMNGYEVARKVRQGSLGRAVTLIAVTGWGQDNDKAQALAAGFNHHFTKPLEPARLSELIRSDSQRRSVIAETSSG